MSKQKRVSFTRTAREMKKVQLEMEPDMEQGSKTTKQVGVELELQENSLSDVVADTYETPETIVEEPEVEQGSKTTKQVEVELELQRNSLNDVVADTHKTPESTAEEPDVEQGSKTTKQVRVGLELQENSLSDVGEDTHETSETIAEEPDVEQVTPELVLRRSSSTIRVLEMYVPSSHYLLLMKGNHNPLRRPYSWRIQPSGSKPWMMGRLGFKNALY